MRRYQMCVCVNGCCLKGLHICIGFSIIKNSWKIKKKRVDSRYIRAKEQKQKAKVVKGRKIRIKKVSQTAAPSSECQWRFKAWGQ